MRCTQLHLSHNPQGYNCIFKVQMKALQTYAHCLHAKHTIPKKPTNCKKKKKKLNEYDTRDKRGELVKEKERQKRAHTLRRLEIVPVSRQVLPFPAFRASRRSSLRNDRGMWCGFERRSGYRCRVYPSSLSQLMEGMRKVKVPSSTLIERI